MMAQAPTRSKYCNCTYIHGLAGTGKTTLVKNMYLLFVYLTMLKLVVFLSGGMVMITKEAL